MGAPETSVNEEHPVTSIRPAIDADHVRELRQNPAHEGGKLDIAIDETFPASDAPSNTQPGKGKDPPPSSGYDEAEEAARASDAT